jgi:hypothetical protein
VVDFNLKQLPVSNAFAVGSFDKKSIMKYFFESWMFVSGSASACFTGENLTISEGAKQGAAKVYPATPGDITTTTEQQATLLQDLLRADTAPAEAKEHFQQTLKRLQS